MAKIVLTKAQGKHLGLSDFPRGFAIEGEYQLLQLSSIKINDLCYRHYVCGETHEIIEVLEDTGNPCNSYSKVRTTVEVFCEFRKLLPLDDGKVILNNKDVQVLVDLADIYFRWLDSPEVEEVRALEYIEDFMQSINELFTPVL